MTIGFFTAQETQHWSFPVMILCIDSLPHTFIFEGTCTFARMLLEVLPAAAGIFEHLTSA